MSFVFSGLFRLNVQPAVGFNDPISDMQEPHTLKTDQTEIRLTLLQATGDEDAMLIFTNNQRFMANTQKKYVLENILHFVPKVLFWFKPTYAVQMAVRFTVRMLSGETNNQAISALIKTNSGISQYFENFLSVCISIFTGNFLNNVMINEHFSVLALGALLEVLYLNRKESFNHPMIMPAVLVGLGDINCIFTGNQSKNKPDWLKRGTKNEICMLTADFTCVMCCLIFDTTAELKVHVLNAHDKFACMKCKVEFGTYEELLSHKLTFCKYPTLLTECNWCKETAVNCVCAQMHSYVLNAMQQHVGSSNKCKMITNNMYSFMYNYVCEMATLNHSNPTFEKKDLSDFSQESVTVLLSDLCPVFELSNVGRWPSISCVEWGIESIPWALVKCRLQPFFDTFMEAINHFNTISNKSLNICTTQGCIEKFSEEHFNMHFICPFARTFQSNELVHYFPIQEFNDENRLVRHFKEHEICFDVQMLCLNCHDDIGDFHGNTSIELLFDHGGIHELDLHSVPKNCEFSGCMEVKFRSILDYIQHQIFFHAASNLHITQFLELMVGRKIVKPRNNQFYAADIPGDSIIRSRPRLRSNEGRSRVVSGQQSQSPCFDKKDSKKSLNNEFEKIYHEEKLILSKSGDSFTLKCSNEKHDYCWSFQTIIEKTKHLILMHSCPIVKCSFYCEMDKDMIHHMELVHDNQGIVCVICKIKVKHIEDHLLSHPACNACKVRFLDQAMLKGHEPTCETINTSQSDLNTQTCTENSLNIDAGLTENDFVRTLHTILDRVSLDETDRRESKLAISKFAAEATLAKTRKRSELVSTRRASQLFFDIPGFAHTEKSNLPKILTTIGKLNESDKFSADSASSSRCAIENFELLDNLLRQVDRHISIGFLNEAQSILVLSLHISQRVQDEVSSFTGHTDLKYLGFKECIESLQFIFCPLKLEKLLTLVLNYKINLKFESFLSFSSRVTRHLTLCARMFPDKDRRNFIELHRKNIIKLNLPTTLMEEVEKKEALFSEYSSSELLEIVVSYLEHNEIDPHNFDRMSENYRVYATAFSSQGTFRKAQGKNEMDKTPKKEKYKRVKQILHKGDQPPLNTPPQQNSNNFYSEGTKQRLELLKSRGLQVEPVICFMCLGRHRRSACPHYDQKVEYGDLCTKVISGANYGFGFHARTACTHGENIKFGRKLSERADKKSNPPQTPQSVRNSNWKPYRK